MKSKFGTPSNVAVEKCGAEKQNLIACLNENKDSPLVCQQVSDDYVACSVSVVTGCF